MQGKNKAKSFCRCIFLDVVFVSLGNLIFDLNESPPGRAFILMLLLQARPIKFLS